MGFFGPDIEKLDKENKIDEIAKCLDNRKPSVRRSAFAALAVRTGLSKEKTDKLHGMTHDPNTWVKTFATLMYVGMGDKSVADSIIDIIHNGRPDDRAALMRVIQGCGPTEEGTILQVIVDGLMDRKETVRINAIRAAGSTKSRHLVPYLGDKLHAKHHKERLAAASALFEIGGDESIDYLIGLLADNHPEVHAAARMYLEKVDNEIVKKALNEASFMQLIRDMGDREPVRQKTAQFIGSERIREALPLLHRSCRDKYKGVRIQALKSIALFKYYPSVDVVEKLLADKFYDVRIEAINTLEKIGGQKALRAIETALTDKSVVVRKRAEQALDIKHDS